MSKVIGKVLATEKNPSTMEEFYFWTKPDLILNPFDVVKVEHINDSITYGVIEEISHITDTANFLSDFISNDFGELNTSFFTNRVSMNYVNVRARDILHKISGYFYTFLISIVVILLQNPIPLYLPYSEIFRFLI